MSMHAILQGREVVVVEDLLSWARRFEQLDRHVGLYETSELMVSTVFLGINHQWSPGGPPLWFETMVFRKRGGEVEWQDLDMERCTTYDEAEEMHHRLVMKWDHPGELVVGERAEMVK